MDHPAERENALKLAINSLAGSHASLEPPTSEDIVKRAESFLAFLTGEASHSLVIHVSGGKASVLNSGGLFAAGDGVRFP